MLRHWMGNPGKNRAVTGDELACFAPFRNLAPGDLEARATLAARERLQPGPWKRATGPDLVHFLAEGSVRIELSSGPMLRLAADMPQAAYPLPVDRRVKALHALQPSVVIGLPHSAVETAPRERDARDRAVLSPDEQQALDALEAYLGDAHCNLPSLPELALKIGQAIDAPRTSNDDVARLIQLDPVLGTRVLSVVNSAAFGGVSKISSIQQAVARLGRNKVRNLVYSFLLKNMFRVSSGTLKRHMERLWSRAAHVAALSFVLGKVTPGIDPEQALLAGLVHDIGAVAVIGAINRFPILERREEALHHALAALSKPAGIETLRQWQLGEELQEVVAESDDLRRIGSAIAELPDIVILARLHAAIGSPEQARLPPIDSLPAFCKLAGGELTPRRSLHVLDAAETEIRELRMMIGAD